MDSRFLFKYSSKDAFKNLDIFFDYPFLIELDLSSYPFFFIPPSITQCQLIERVNITNTNFNEPPAILFALPQIRAHPENLIFGKNQQCTKDLMMNIIGSCSSYNQGFLSFKNAYGKISSVSYSPDTTTLDFLLMMHPELKSNIHNIFLVREIKLANKTHKLYIIPDDVPMILYQYHNSTWSIELQFKPSVETDENSPYIRINSNLSESYLYQATLKNPNPIDKINISISSTSASIRYSPSSYVVCDNSNIYLQYIEGNVLLFFGKKAIVITNDTIEKIYPLFKYSLPHFYFEPNQTSEVFDEKRELFLNLAMKTALKSLSIKSVDSYPRKLARKALNH